MNYFQDIQSLADLKKQYRSLALANHPDRGGSTAVMQQINLQFEKLYPLWEHRQSLSQNVTGYEDDHAGASAKEYADYVYNEYRWKGKNYKGQSNHEIIDIIRGWIKETYPRYRFLVHRDGYSSFYIHLTHADFVAFTPQAEGIVYMQINEYSIMSDGRLTDRAKEVMQNVYEFVKSYHFDDSDSMVDYFNTNFYIHLSIGDHRHPYRIVVPKLKGVKPDAAAQFKHPEGQAHKAIRQALGKNRFVNYESRGHGKIVVLGYEVFEKTGESDYYPLRYSSRKTAQKRIDKLLVAGINCSLSGYNGGFITFSGYSEETEKALEKERHEFTHALKAWNEKHKKNQIEGATEKRSFFNPIHQQINK